jgi:hypothetical protein
LLEKPLTEYYVQGGACKVCARTRQRELHAQRTLAQKERDAAVKLAYAKANKDRLKEISRAYRTSEHGRTQRAAYAEKNREKIYALNKKSAAKNRANARRYAAKYRAENKEKLHAYFDTYYRCSNVREKVNARLRSLRNNLPDHYVRTVLTQRTALDAKDIPQSLVEVKRLQIQILRMVKNEKR